jgi:L-iditol 2-dehydrogenase
VTYEEAAILEPMAVAVHAMRRVEMTAADTVAVWGLGTIGILLVMFLLEKGMKNVFAIGNKKAQMQMLRKIGLPETDFCDSRTENVAHWLRERTDGAGADVCFECVGKNETYSQATELAAPGGRVCLVGNPYGDMGLDKQVYWNLLRNEVTVTGTWNSSFTGKTGDDWHYVLERLKRKSIAPAELISHRLPIEDLEQGFGIMRDKSEDYIKIMMKNS